MKAETVFRCFALAVGLSFYLGDGINYAQLGPFFPTEAAINHGVSTTLIGIITSATDVAILCSLFVLTRIVTPENQKFIFCAGAFLSANASALFGALGWSGSGWDFVAACIFARVTMGVGGAMIYTTGVAMLVAIFPHWSGKVTSVIQCTVGLGQMSGPTIGSLLYSIGGYTLPFFVSGGIEVFFSIVAMFFLPNYELRKLRQREVALRQQQCNAMKNSSQSKNKNKSKEVAATTKFVASNEHLDTLEAKDTDKCRSDSVAKEEASFIHFITRPVMLFACIPLMCQSCSLGFVDVAVGPYLNDYFGVDGNTSGYYFLAFSGAYCIASPVMGILTDKGHAAKVYVLCTFSAGAAFILLGLPSFVEIFETRWWLILWLAVVGMTSSGGYVTCYLVFETIAYRIGFRDCNKIKIMTAGAATACFSFGRVFGPVVTGGIVMDLYGYYISCLVQGTFMIIGSLSGFVVCLKLGLLGRIYYEKTEETEKLKESFGAYYESVATAELGDNVRESSVTLIKSEKEPRVENSILHNASSIMESIRIQPVVALQASQFMAYSERQNSFMLKNQL